MKNKIYPALFALTVLFTACGEFTDIKPKGKSLLDNVGDLDMLLNYSYSHNPAQAYVLVND